MPFMRNRPTGVFKTNSEAKKGTPRPSAGVRKGTGTDNTNAGSQHTARPWALEGKSVVIKTPA